MLRASGRPICRVLINSSATKRNTAPPRSARQPRIGCCSCAFSQDADRSRSSELPRQARVVICGGGVAGLAVGYHLAKLGWKDVVLLEQGKLASGATWSAAGIMGILRRSHFSTRLSRRSYNLYTKLEAETGIHTGLRRCGSVYIAQTGDLMVELRKRHANAKAWGIDSELLSMGEVNGLLPWIRADDLEGGLLVRDDAYVQPKEINRALAKAASDGGVTLLENTEVQRVLSSDGRVSSVLTKRGSIECEVFINCAGLWARDLGLASSPEVRVPLHPLAQQYLITKPVKSLTMDSNGPYVRDMESLLYIQEHGGGFLFGGYAPKGKPVFEEGLPLKKDAEHIHLPDDWDHFRHLLEGFLHRVPQAGDVQFEKLFNNPESFTPDGEFIMGEAPEMRNYFILAGFCSQGLTFAGGAGELLAGLIASGHTDIDYWPVNVQRFSPQHNSKAFLRTRVKEIESIHYRVAYPAFSHRSGRKLRCPPLYSSLGQEGAVFGERMGVERPKWYMASDDTDEFAQETQRGTFGKPQWFDLVDSEYWACRESVCLMDMSAFTKLELTSPGNEATMLLQRLCPNNLDGPIGSVVHTGMLNDRGGYECDCSIARLDTNRYFIICPTIQLVKAHCWISNHLPSDGSVTLRDLTNQYAGLNVLGPKARDVVQKLTTTSLSTADFRPFSCKELNVGFATGVKAMSITHAGEDGMVLYIPNETAVQVYDALRGAGKDCGIRSAGYYALRWLRIEKFYFYWGEDFDSTTTPFEIGRDMRVKFDKGVEFIGESALLRQRQEGVKRHLVGFILEDHNINTDLWPWGREPIYRDGRHVGMTTCSSYGPTQGKMICLGWLTHRDADTGQLLEVTSDFIHKGQYEMDIAGKRFPLKARLYPLQLGAKQPTHG